MTQIVKIICPGCKMPMFSKEIDSVLLCEKCSVMHVRDGGTKIVQYDVGQFTRQGEGERIYLPHWALDVSFEIQSVNIQGGSLGNLFGLLGNQERRGNVRFFAPAYDIEPVKFKDIAVKMTSSPPAYSQGRLEPGVRRARATVDANQLEQVADFLFVTGIAEKSGVLQKLDYTLQVNSSKLVYLPYYKKDDRMQPGY